MNRCPNCRDLEGQAGDPRPPARMRPQTTYFVRGGLVEAYRCQVCGRQWERFVHGEKLGAQTGPWKTLKAYQSPD